METEVGGQDGGESTENEEDADGNESMSNRNISVEVNDLWYLIDINKTCIKCYLWNSIMHSFNYVNLERTEF